MAMQFSMAGRPQEAQLMDASSKQNQIAAALRQQKQNKIQMLGSGAASLASMVPEGAWGALGGAITGTPAAGAAAGAVAPEIGAALTGLGPAGWAALLAGGLMLGDVL